jgi:hypothetical protein
MALESSNLGPDTVIPQRGIRQRVLNRDKGKAVWDLDADRISISKKIEYPTTCTS